MSWRLLCLVSALLPLAAQASEPRCPLRPPCYCAAAKDGKLVIIEVRKRSEPLRWAKVTYHNATIPVRAIGTGIYYGVQGPRMLAELIAFGRIGESFSATHESLMGNQSSAGPEHRSNMSPK